MTDTGAPHGWIAVGERLPAPAEPPDLFGWVSEHESCPWQHPTEKTEGMGECWGDGHGSCLECANYTPHGERGPIWEGQR